ncbi:hypothetical protein FOQG_15294 [Fusarium oxysporum f. sp. raphani 54005]|uniref:Uncharacterized protein n=2 Tax=Fusarium oxysporum TaxID=5507 RepID=X0CBZ0_FUSOX|nr:hypothetical protein FOVG_14759 [Fusarium oxysporum f. sp. pisi HDV247]EXK80162.1 hypothetical protein FOQG_15294 [Fusarium oxysporum f. sp. raphani 54005]KAJ4035910.1 hypothetical protein NW758_010313 [Fusarium oxysporum]KAJ4037465.1 hypothetical protein NW763_013625 [Fusarium oxysporum]KAJ4041454.1 hypothetical protein NW753_010865 [Fusarium oxysporum]
MPSSASFLFAFFFVSLVFAKLLHLYIHLQSITAIDFIVYLPTFLLQDVFLACLARLLLRPRRTIRSFVGYILASILTLIPFGGASSEPGFYYKTGGEIDWIDAGDFVNGEGLNVLVSESSGVLVAALIIIIVSWFTQTLLYRFVGNLISGLGKHIASVAEYLGTKIRPQKHVQHDPKIGGGEEKHSRDEPSWQQRWCFIPSWVLTSTVLVFIGITAIVRPDKPFNHMSTSLPSRIRDSFRTTLVFCASNNEWTLKGLIDKTKWLDPSGDFKGWAPGTDNNKFVKQYRENPPKWLSEPIPAGFLKWDRNRYQNNYKDVGTETRARTH